jgi:hypothetical protein
MWPLPALHLFGRALSYIGGASDQCKKESGHPVKDGRSFLSPGFKDLP